jgi:UDP-glucose 4-epimerase
MHRTRPRIEIMKSMQFSQLSGARVLITGGLGLIGSAIARQLAPLGCEILILDNLDKNLGGNRFNIESVSKKIALRIGDLCDERSLSELVSGTDFIFNLAAQTGHMDSMTAPFADLRVNSTAQLLLMEQCRTNNASARIVYASTRQVYGRPLSLPVGEDHPTNPVDINGVNKIAGESYHVLYHRVHDLKTTVLRLTNTYGPGMRIKDARQIFLGFWIRRVLENEPFEVWGGSQRRDFTFVEDAATAFIAAAICAETIGNIYNLGGSDIVSLQALADKIVRINGGGSYVLTAFPEDRKRIDIGDYYADDRRFRAVTGWKPAVDLAEGLSRTLDFYRSNLRQYV